MYTLSTKLLTTDIACEKNST